MDMLKFFVLALSLTGSINSFSQAVTLKAILDATKTCNTPEQFTDYIKAYGFCFNEKREMPSFTYYTHFKCGASEIGAQGIRINFAVSNDGSLNSSFLTRNDAAVKGFTDELKAYQFEETPHDGEARENAAWYASTEFPGILILWEYNTDDQGQKVWHIGFVWNRPDN